jgi:hypothetical protein
VSGLETGADFIRSEGEATESDWEHFTQILAKLRDDLPRDVELVVDLLPSRQALEAADLTASPPYRAGQRAAMIATGLGIRTVDAWDVLANAVQRDGSRRYFATSTTSTSRPRAIDCSPTGWRRRFRLQRDNGRVEERSSH